MSKKKCVVERLKSLLIVVLTVTALGLLADSRLLGHLSGPQIQREDRDEEKENTQTIRGQVTLPLAIAVVNQEGCFGAQYSKQQVSELFEQMAPVLGEALSGAGEPRLTTQEQWQRQLSDGTGLWLDLQGQVPLGVLTTWLAGEQNPNLTAYGEHLLLSVEGQQVRLYYQDAGDGQFYVCDVELVSTSYLSDALEQVTGNEVRFAFQMPGLESLQPQLLVSNQTPQPGEYAVANPLQTDGQERMDLLLEQLSFPVEITNVYDTPEGRRARSGNDTLTISNRGEISYASTREEGRYPVDDGTDPEFCAVDGARELVCAVLERWSGSGGLYLHKVQKVRQDCWQVEFRYEIDGIPALVGSQGFAARVLVDQGFITEYVMQLNSFTPLGSQLTPVLPLHQAAAVMAGLDGAGEQLRLCYQMGGETLRAGWIME